MAKIVAQTPSGRPGRVAAGNSSRVFVRSGSRDVARELKTIVQDTDSGVRTTPAQRKAILQCVAKLRELGEGVATTGTDMSATWRMLWTTEKETLFILKNCKFFNKAPGDVFQVIDGEQGTLQNAIEFEPDSVFGVDASIEVASPQRVNFVFRRAFYREAGKKPFQLPPLGKGWFENVYMDDEIRVAKDIRRDTLITERYGPPQSFS